MHVDIFYSAINYQIVEQLPVFEFLSLLSEIGGFLGLLLGASVLTVCELLDYAFILAMKKWMNNKVLHSGGTYTV